MIRLALEEDIPAIIAGESGAWEALKLPGVFNPEYFQSRLEHLLKAGLGVLVADFDTDGVVTAAAGAALSREMHTGKRMATQIFWTANRKRKSSAALRVFKEMLAECERRGAEILLVSYLFDSNAGRMNKAFKRLGYQPSQAVYIKPLAP